MGDAAMSLQHDLVTPIQGTVECIICGRAVRRDRAMKAMLADLAFHMHRECGESIDPVKLEIMVRAGVDRGMETFRA
jgi:hypothetical protein